MNPIKPYQGLFKTYTVKDVQQMRKNRRLLKEDIVDLSNDEIIDLLHFATMSTYLLNNLPERVLEMIQQNLDSIFS